MGFGGTSGVATSFSRHLKSRRAFRLYLWGFAIIVVPAIALRVQAVLFERRALSVVSALSGLRVGTSSKAEALSRLPILTVYGMGPYGARCDADQCVSGGIPNSALSDAVFLRAARTGNRTLVSLLSWLGFRYWSLDAYVNFTSGKVSYLSYRLMVYTPHFDDLEDPDVVVVEVSSKAHADVGNPALNRTEEDPFRVSPSRRSPSQSVGITFTPDAPSGLVTRAFDLKLRCLWSFTGCRTWHQLLPAVETLDR
jgi:hypothetical protein